MSAGSAAPPVRHASRLRYCASEAVADPAQAPEQQPPRTVGAAEDIWAIGAIAFELLTQERVFPPDATDDSMMGALREASRLAARGAGVPGARRCEAAVRGVPAVVVGERLRQHEDPGHVRCHREQNHRARGLRCSSTPC